MEPEWHLIGQFSVRSGLIWLGDPYALITDHATWREFCSAYWAKAGLKGKYSDTNDGITVDVGEGNFPVYVRIQNGEILELRIDFQEEIKCEKAE